MEKNNLNCYIVYIYIYGRKREIYIKLKKGKLIGKEGIRLYKKWEIEKLGENWNWK